jgi:hypothetical protein
MNWIKYCNFALDMNNKNLYADVSHEPFEVEISDLGYMSETEGVNYAIDKFNRAVSRINRELLGYDINIQKATDITDKIEK